MSIAACAGRRRPQPSPAPQDTARAGRRPGSWGASWGLRGGFVQSSRGGGLALATSSNDTGVTGAWA